jgi:hypothetical protein
MKKFLYILLVFLFVSCGKDFKHRKMGSTISLTTETVGTYDANTLDVIVRLAEQRNSSAIMKLIDSGDAVMLKEGMSGIIRHAKVGKFQIEILSGKQLWGFV